MEQMKRLAMVINLEQPGAAALAREVRAQLERAGMESAADETPAGCARCDAIVAIGGDGTILRAARLALPCQKPVLGVNAGRLGFLAGLERHEISALGRLATGDYLLERRMLLEVRVFDGDICTHEQRCVNDAVISRYTISHLAELSVACGGHNLTYRGDGVIFSTPTGSTAYGLSAGGPVVDPHIETILLTPICSHRLFSRTVVFAPDTLFSTEIAQEGLCLTCDAEPPLPLQPGQRLTIRRAEESAQFIRLKTGHFLDILNEKLMG
ncbi:MAG: NAD(+)/NADH kinase [Oscillospiraceae bacterium]|jgi:NAD+ kinase|nr:NAD(+)/NADH kinase [Oscillospiraceae bacterium]